MGLEIDTGSSCAAAPNETYTPGGQQLATVLFFLDPH